MKPILFDNYGNSIRHIIPNPSEKLIDGGSTIPIEKRKRMIDCAARYTSENTHALLGRPEMCLQFSILIQHILLHEGIHSDVKKGHARYTTASQEFEWEHYWVEINSSEIIDCNIDSILYHPDVPDGIEPYNYWGNITTYLLIESSLSQEFLH